MELKEPDMAYNNYTYADYLTWTMEGMVELIRGKVYKMSAAPRRNHQSVSWRLSGVLYNYLNGKDCKAFAAPFDVRLPLKSTRNEDITTVVQPDISVICDASKLDEAGCLGAPDIVVEILSVGNNKKELKNKYDVYEESGVKEYWIINTEEQNLLIYTLVDGAYKPSKLFTLGDEISTPILPGLVVKLDDVFCDLSF
jgi:Uma2 family endonuclease